MGWKFVWWLHIERVRDEGDTDHLSPRWLRIIGMGLAVVGVAAIIIYKTFN